MTNKEFLSKYTLEEFTNWFKDFCIFDSFNCIEEGKSFKTVIITEGNDNMTRYFHISYRDNIKQLLYTLSEDSKTIDIDTLYDYTSFLLSFRISYNGEFDGNKRLSCLPYKYCDNAFVLSPLEVLFPKDFTLRELYDIFQYHLNRPLSNEYDLIINEFPKIIYYKDRD